MMIALQLAVLVAVGAQDCPITPADFCSKFGTTDGLYPNPCDPKCTTYFNCFHSGASAVAETCGDLAFNPAGYCDYPENFKCEAGSGGQSPLPPPVNPSPSPLAPKDSPAPPVHQSPSPLAPHASPAASPIPCEVDLATFCQSKVPGISYPHPCDQQCTQLIRCDCASVATVKECSSGLVYNAGSQMCDLPEHFQCPTQPGQSPYRHPDNTPPPTPPAASPKASPFPAASPGAGLPEPLGSLLRQTATKEILKWEYAVGQYKPSTVYVWEDMLTGLAQMYNVGVGTNKFWLGDGSPQGHIYGAVSVAAFLAQSMKETIKYNACDENNWDQHANFGKDSLIYTSASACGQLGQSYQDYKCGADEPVADMACTVDKTMKIRAQTTAAWYGAPPPMFCAPKSVVEHAYGWSTGGWCKTTGDDVPDYDTDMTFEEYMEYMKKGPSSDTGDWNTRCRDYVGQQGGEWGGDCGGKGCANWAAPNFGKPNRTDVEGCCWWGRGVIQTTGVCNFGKLNYYLGARAAREQRTSMFPDVDFCADPEAICASKKYPELKWIAGFYYYMTEVQSWNADGFDYMTELKAFVDAGMPRGNDKFINAVSGIVNRGCPRETCAAGPVDGLWDRSANFRAVLVGMGLVS